MNQPEAAGTDTAKHGGLIGLFTRHKVAANMLMAMMILSGIIALKLLNVQFFPSAEPRIVNVITAWGGASTEDIESAITTPLEQRLRNVEDIEQITSTSVSGNSAITLSLESGANLILTLDQIQREIDGFGNMPQDAEDTIVRTGGHFETVARVLIRGEVANSELRALAYRFEEELLARGIDAIDFSGLSSEDIQITLKPSELESLGLSLQQVADRVRKISQDQPAGLVGKADGSRELRGLGKRRTPEDFARIPVISTEQSHVELGSVAKITRSARQREAYVTVQGQRAIVLTLKRAASGDSLKAAGILQEWATESLPNLPDNISVQVFNERWTLIKGRIDLMIKNGGGGLLLVLIILFLFLSGRVAFWVAVGIPVSFMATLAVMYLAGSSINMISLFALIMALGIIVDDAIVVAEDAQAHFEAGESGEQAAAGGAIRMLAPVMASSLTTIAAFLPLMFVGGFMGRLMFAIPLVIIAVIIASLIESFLVLPGHLRHAFKGVHRTRRSNIRLKLDAGFERFRDHGFRPWVRAALEYRWATIFFSLMLLVFAVGLFMGGRLSWTFFPSPESTTVNANVRFVAGTSDTTTNAFLKHLEASLIETIDELGEGVVETWYVNHRALGGRLSRTRGDRVGGVYVELTAPDSRDITNRAFVKHWRKKVRVPVGVESFTLAARRSGGSSTDLEIRLVGQAPAQMKRAALALAQSLRDVNGVSAVDDDLAFGREQLIFALTAQGEALGLTLSDIARQLRNAYEGILVQRIQDGRDEVDVRVSLPEADRNALSSLEVYPIRTSAGDFLPLESVVSWQTRQGFETLRHADGLLAVSITANVDEGVNNTQAISEQLKAELLPSIAAEYGVQSSLEGKAKRQRDTLADLKLGLKVGLVLIYMVLAWVFSSYGWPILVMLIIPFGITGAILGHWMMGMNLTILSLFGLFGLSGIVINDSIILVTFYRQLREKGMAINPALEEAACQRLRAVMLTSLTTVAGLTPLLFETSRQAQFLIPMVLSIASGLTFATFLILFLLPSMLSVYEGALHEFKK
ncbi:MAG: efflux RND transporter permease subunit [Arenicellales bacterium]